MASNTGYINGVEYRFTTTGEGKIRAVLAEQQNQLNGVTAAAKQTQAGTAKLSGSMASLAKSILPAVSAFIVLNKATKFLGDSYKAAEQQQLSMKKLDATLQATGRSATFTTQELSKMASGLQKVSNFGDEEIMDNAIASLLRYDSINKETFERALQLTIDLAAETNDLSGAANTLGLSLDDPILGMTRLRRAGVSFSKEQQNVIKGLVDSGKAAEAQAALMDALESKYGGLAKSQISYTKQLKNVWGDFQELIGAKLKPTMDGFYLGMQAALNAMINTATQATATLEEKTKKTIGGIARAVGSAVIVIKGIFELAANGIVAVIVSVEAVFRSWIAVATGLRNAVKLMNPFGSASLSDLDPLAGLGDKLKDAWSKPGKIGSVFKDFGNTIQAQLDSLYRDIDTSLTNYFTKGKSGGGLEVGLGGLGDVASDGWERFNEEMHKLEENLQNVATPLMTVDEYFTSIVASKKAITDITDGLINMTGGIQSVTQQTTELTDAQQRQYDMVESLVGATLDGFAQMVTEGKSFGDVMKDIWKSWVAAAISELNKLIARMLVMKLFSAIFNPVGTLGNGLINPLGAAASDTIGGTIQSYTPRQQPITLPGGDNSLLHAIRRLETAVNKNPVIVYTQLIEGLPLRNAVRRAELQANMLGS